MKQKHLIKSVLASGLELSLETGKIASLTDGAVVARCGRTVVIATAVADTGWRDIAKGGDPEASANLAFVPLTVDYRQKYASSGKLPRTFDRNDGPQNSFMLHSRSIDRCLRPRFPQYSFQPTQVVVTVYSVDPDCTDANPVALGVTAASAALGVSDINFDAPIAAPMSTIEAIDESSFRIFCCVDENEKVIALEGSGGELPEEALVEAARRASRDALPFIDVQAQLIDAAGKHKRESGVAHIDAGIIDFARAAGRDALQGVFSDPRVASDKLERGKAVGRVQKDVEVALSSAYPDAPASHMRAAATESVRCAVRARVAGGGRVDGRAFDEVRPILAETGILPIPSSLFSRGETQVLATCTLDEPGSVRRVDSEIERGVHADGLNGQFVLNYEFPSFVNNEVGRLMGTEGRAATPRSPAFDLLLRLLFLRAIPKRFRCFRIQ